LDLYNAAVVMAQNAVFHSTCQIDKFSVKLTCRRANFQHVLVINKTSDVRMLTIHSENLTGFSSLTEYVFKLDFTYRYCSEEHADVV
jgi:hypothetical protein